MEEFRVKRGGGKNGRKESGLVQGAQRKKDQAYPHRPSEHKDLRVNQMAQGLRRGEK